MSKKSKSYRASLSQTKGRQGYSIIFRHPVRKDKNTGKPGLRVRQGLGTNDEAEASKLVDQMNELLSNPEYWTLASQAVAKDRFDSRIVNIFYHKLVPQPTNFLEERDRVIPLPSSKESDYRSVLLLGTTGAGKTTLLRQIIGTHPTKERFPSTSTSKTTVADTEILIAKGEFSAVVTFMEQDEVRDYLEECVSKAVLVAYQNKSDPAILRALLQHVDQRIRFNYILGNGPFEEHDEFDEEDAGEENNGLDHDLEWTSSDSTFDLDKTNEILLHAVERAKTIAQEQGEQLKEELNATEESDQRVVDELFEDELDRILRQDEEYHAIADELMDEIEIRFKALTQGNIRKTKQGWPVYWEFTSRDRNSFIREIRRFSSNHAPLFGTLLTPLVNGIRVKGPFLPLWDKSVSQPLVLIDGEGLGHTPDSSSSLSTRVIRRMGEVDAIVLVDNATQPMQAAPVAALRSLIQTGNIKKLLMTFTHFDEVKGDNLPNISAKKEHVLASVENVMTSLGDDLGPNAERTLRAQLNSQCYFLGGIDKVLDPTKKRGQQSIDQLKKLLSAIGNIIKRPESIEVRPVYDRMNLALAIREAADQFQEVWLPRLGRKHKSGIDKEHWTRIKALSRRLANGWADEYDNLRPVSDLHKQLGELIYVTIQEPVRWEGEKPEEDGQQQIFDELSSLISIKLLELASRRVWVERSEEWQTAYNQSGPGSTFIRAEIIDESIYRKAAPVPNLTPSPDRNKFLHEVLELVESACHELNIKLI